MSEREQQRVFIFIGRSGSGKGTQAGLLRDHFLRSGLRVFSHETGASLRELAGKHTYTAGESRKIMNEGGIQPSFLAVWAWSDNFIRNITGDEHVLIDGTPRTLVEAHVLDTAFSFYNLAPTVFYIHLSRESAERRLLLRGRQDDNKDDIRERLGWFEADVVPAIKYYKGAPHVRFCEINGEGTVEDVFREVIKKSGL